MKNVQLLVLCLALLCLPLRLAAGGLPVYDAISDAKKTWDTIQRTAAEVRAYGQMIRQY
jgi:hypothetical protein